jgi:hypothetical protein
MMGMIRAERAPDRGSTRLRIDNRLKARRAGRFAGSGKQTHACQSMYNDKVWRVGDIIENTDNFKIYNFVRGYAQLRGISVVVVGKLHLMADANASQYRQKPIKARASLCHSDFVVV